ncbi:alpha/beta fold hydrolase [Spirosoma endbachense]|uniref:Alpha/beta fold hydrolase n=1 Tax=Spirosoma endbachense TaxID=2666025 RepID=A0A6P1W9W5_9BACT|nr:alpha/beta fold hydrolase [Spirosoma endbachense]QHW00828.1 alpha/beta fold hydrolase [Spirosoma endbachense]
MCRNSQTKVVLILFFLLPFYQGIAQQRFAELGNFSLENGQVIQNCQLGYRTFGRLNAAKSNAILVPTWFGGTSQGKAFVANPGGIADSTSYFTIVVDALGNGVSSSPSNSTAQAGAQFPQFTIRDMVRSEYELVTKSLGLTHLYAVMGISMGGMQSFEWLVSYPDFMDKVVPIVGAPKQSSYDRLFWGTQLTILERGNFAPEAMKTVGDLHELNLTTPSYFMSHLKAEEEPDFVQKKENGYVNTNPYNWASQLRAMIGHDIYRGRSMAELKSAIKAKLLIVVAKQDHMVTPGMATELAKFLQVPFVELTSDCGHLATSCEEETIKKSVRQFWESK